ncbi:MYND zinc finger protein [Biomphalaria pfeifferi]|uniref:MYND zinc finger protein n=1 Tax=Biomphalaria pfeifferi TaxID=112525 RepID=A0AAD8C5J8_BIOPF|nr:MYND zinc finger protein [Biomphalaria pfeifferi]
MEPTSCKKCGSQINVKKCARCQIVSYCSRQCQRDDYTNHRDICVLFAEFNAAKNRLTEQQRKLLLENPWYMGHSYFIESLPDSFRYKMLGQRIVVILKIISNMQSDEEGFRFVNVSDVTNKVTTLRFRLQDSDEVDSLKYKLRVGTFVAIVQARLSVYSYMDKASEIVIENLKQVEFIRGT